MEIMYYGLFRVANILNSSDVSSLPQTTADSNAVQTILKIVFGIAGGIALIMVVLGGLKYINSLGNADNVAKAKDTILYALIGLVVCILAYTLISFVLKKVSP